MTVPFLDVRATYQELRDEIDAAIARVLASGRYVLGGELTAFEHKFAAYCGTPRCVGTSNGLDALRLALRALDIGPGDEVIVPANTFIGTFLVVSQMGAVSGAMDTGERRYKIDPSLVGTAITPRTRAIVPVHLFGQPSDMEPIVAVAERHGLPVIEDAPQAHGARYRERPCGSLAKAAAWSFYPGKNLGAFGDGGGLTTADADLADRVEVLRNYGSRSKYEHEVAGENARLDELQAAILLVKLGRLDAWNRRRIEIAATYTEAFADCDLVTPYVPPWAEPVWHLYVVRTRRRDEFRRALDARGIATLIHYPVPAYLQP